MNGFTMMKWFYWDSCSSGMTTFFVRWGNGIVLLYDLVVKYNFYVYF